MMFRMARLVIWLVLAALAGLIGYAFLAARPEDLPWTPLDLSQPMGLFTGRKLAGLADDGARCRALLDRAGVAHISLPPHRGETGCGYDDAVRLSADRDQIGLEPASVGMSCPVAAALKLWEWHVVQPAAQRLLGQPVASITHYGSYSCRRLYWRSTGEMSEHATADALDVSGFVLADGRRISVAPDWKSGGGDAAFLRAVRDGACKLYATVLSPDYNAAHHDHLHLDQAERGEMGWRVCR